MKAYSRVHADIDLDAFSYNLAQIASCIPSGTGVIAVVKADGYGHGAVEISRVLEDHPCVWGYAVASVDEALLLREAGRKKPILILGYTFPEQHEIIIREQIRPAVYSYEAAKQISEAAAHAGETVRIHIKLDTGMGRIGFFPTPETVNEIVRIAALPHLEIEGIFTHFATADERDKAGAKKQMEDYCSVIEQLYVQGIEVPYHHVANSAATIDLPQYHMDLVRAGIILYGLWPSDEVKKDVIGLKPVLSLKSHVIHIKELKKGSRVSYGGTYQLPEDEVIATIPVGYADGYPRSLSNRGHVLIHGKKAPIRGRVCMDQLMVDITGIENVRIGDPVTIIGRDGSEAITIEELGELSGRFNYEFVCALSKRIPRNYYQNGKLTAQMDYFSS